MIDIILILSAIAGLPVGAMLVSKGIRESRKAKGEKVALTPVPAPEGIWERGNPKPDAKVHRVSYYTPDTAFIVECGVDTRADNLRITADPSLVTCHRC